MKIEINGWWWMITRVTLEIMFFRLATFIHFVYHLHHSFQCSRVLRHHSSMSLLLSLSDLESIWDPCHDSVHQVYLFLTYFRINTRSCSFISIAHYVSYGVTMAILFHISYFHVLKIFFRCWKNFSIPSLQVATSNFRSNFTRRVLKLSSKSESERMRKEYFLQAKDDLMERICDITKNE